MISRDGSIIYKNAISKVHPLLIQVTDRFNLLKNLTSYCKDYLKTKFNTYVKIDNIENITICNIDTKLLKNRY